jgi:hypothetical protein
LPERPQDYVLCLRYLAERAVRRGQRLEAEALWREAIANGNACLARDPDNFDARVSLCWACVEFYNRLLRESAASTAEAENLLSDALAHATLATQQGATSTAARDVAASIKSCLATCYFRTERAGEGLGLYREAIDDVESLCADAPWNAGYWHTLEWFHDDLVANLRDAGQLVSGQDALREFSAWLAEIGPQLPAESGPQTLVRQTRRNLVNQLRTAGLTHEADELARELE